MVEILPDPYPSLIQAKGIKVLQPGYENPEDYSSHDMATTFVDNFKGSVLIPFDSSAS